MSRTTSARAALIRSGVALAAVTVAVAGCTSTPATSTTAPVASGSPSAGDPSATATSTDPTSTDPTSTDPSATDAATPSPSDTGTASPTATPSPSATIPAWTNDAGKTFDTVQQAAGVILDANGVKAQVLVHPDSVQKVTVADLGPGSTVPKGKLPVFVTITYTNAGTTTLEFPSLGTPLFATQSGGAQAQPYTPTTDVPKCPIKDSPENFKPGSTYTDCQIFIVRKGTTVRELTYRPDTRAGEVTWKVSKDGT